MASSPAQFATNAWPSWQWQFQGKARVDQAIAAVNERCQAAGAGELSAAGWFAQRQALCAVKAKLAALIPAYIDPLNYDESSLLYASFIGITNFPWFSPTTVLARAGAPTNYLAHTPWFDLAAHSNGWRYIPGIVSQLVWTVDDIWFPDFIYDEIAAEGIGDEMPTEDGARASAISNLAFHVYLDEPEGYVISTKVGDSTYKAEFLFHRSTCYAPLPTTNFLSYGRGYVPIFSADVWEPFETGYRIGVSGTNLQYGLTNLAWFAVGTTNIPPVALWGDFPATNGTSITRGWAGDPLYYYYRAFLLKWDGTNGFKYR